MEDLPLASMILAVVMFVTLACVLLTFFAVFRLWLKGFAGGVHTSMGSIVGMRLRGSPPDLILDAAVTLNRSGETVSILDVEKAYLANKDEVQRITGRAHQIHKLVSTIRVAREQHDEELEDDWGDGPADHWADM